MARTAALAYSGGLDTSIIVPWLRETYDADVICMSANLGQREDFTRLEARALEAGARGLFVEDLRNRLIRLIGYGQLTVTTQALDDATYLVGLTVDDTGALRLTGYSRSAARASPSWRRDTRTTPAARSRGGCSA